MNTEQEFFICTACFCASETRKQCHERPMAHYPGYRVGAPQLKPITNISGEMKTGMPRWMLTIQP